MLFSCWITSVGAWLVYRTLPMPKFVGELLLLNWHQPSQSTPTSNPGKLRPQAWPAAAAAAVAAVAEEGESNHHGPRPQDQDPELPRHRLPNLWRVQRWKTEPSWGGPCVSRSWQEVSYLHSCLVTSWLEESATLCLHSLQVNCTTCSESDCKLSLPWHGTSWFWHSLQSTSFLFGHEAPVGCFNIVCADAAKITSMITTLSPRVEPETVDGIVERFSGDGGEGKEGKKVKGREGIDWLQGDFLK